MLRSCWRHCDCRFNSKLIGVKTPYLFYHYMLPNERKPNFWESVFSSEHLLWFKNYYFLRCIIKSNENIYFGLPAVYAIQIFSNLYIPETNKEEEKIIEYILVKNKVETAKTNFLIKNVLKKRKICIKQFSCVPVCHMEYFQ